MKFVCDKCKTKYSIANEKVRRKVLKIRCKNCSHIIVVRESKRSRTAHKAVGTGAHPLAQALDGAFQAATTSSSHLSPVSSPELPPKEARHEPEPTRLSGVPEFLGSDENASPEDEWYLAVDNNQYGPMGFAELCSRIKRGEAAGESYIWRDGFDEWLEPREVPEIRPYLPKHPPPPPRGKSGLYPMATFVTSPAMPQTAGHQVVAVPSMPPPPGSGQRHHTMPEQPAIVPQQPAVVPPQPDRGGSQAAPLPFDTTLPLPPRPERHTADFAPVPPGPSPELSPLAMVAAVPVPPQQQRTPAWMVIAGLGGGLAAICGLILVVYFLFFVKEEQGRQVAQLSQPSPMQQAPAAPAAPDMSYEPIRFQPMEIEQSSRDERVGRRSTRNKRSQPASGRKLTEEQRRLMGLYQGGDTPSETVPSTGRRRRRRTGPRRRISAGEITRLMQMHRASLKICYERAVKRDNTLTKFKAEVMVSVGDTGVVRKVDVKGGNSLILKQCIQRVLKRWVFPPVGAQILAIPIIFRGS